MIILLISTDLKLLNKHTKTIYILYFYKIYTESCMISELPNMYTNHLQKILIFIFILKSKGEFTACRTNIYYNGVACDNKRDILHYD